MDMSELNNNSQFFSEVPQNLGEQSNRAVRKELSLLNAEVPKLQQELDAKRAVLESQQKETDAALQEAQQLFDQALAEFQSVSNTITKIQTALESQKYRSVEKILEERERQQGFATEAERLQKLLEDMGQLKESLEEKATNLQRELQELVSASEQTLEETIIGLSRAEKTRELGEKYESFTRQERELTERIQTLESRRQEHLETTAKTQSGEMSARVSSIVRLAMQSEAVQQALLTPEQIASLTFATEEEIWEMLEGSLSPEQLREVSMEPEFKLYDKNIVQKIIDLLQTENRQDGDLVQLDQEIQRLSTLKMIASEQAQIALGRLQQEFGVTDSVAPTPPESSDSPREEEPVGDAPAADAPEPAVPNTGKDSNPSPVLDTPDNSFDFLRELGKAGAASLDIESTDTVSTLPETSMPTVPEPTDEDSVELDLESFLNEITNSTPAIEQHSPSELLKQFLLANAEQKASLLEQLKNQFESSKNNNESKEKQAEAAYHYIAALISQGNDLVATWTLFDQNTDLFTEKQGAELVVGFGRKSLQLGKTEWAQELYKNFKDTQTFSESGLFQTFARELEAALKKQAGTSDSDVPESPFEPPIDPEDTRPTKPIDPDKEITHPSPSLEDTQPMRAVNLEKNTDTKPEDDHEDIGELVQGIADDAFRNSPGERVTAPQLPPSSVEGVDQNFLLKAPAKTERVKQLREEIAQIDDRSHELFFDSTYNRIGNKDSLDSNNQFGTIRRAAAKKREELLLEIYYEYYPDQRPTKPGVRDRLSQVRSEATNLGERARNINLRRGESNRQNTPNDIPAPEASGMLYQPSLDRRAAPITAAGERIFKNLRDRVKAIRNPFRRTNAEPTTQSVENSVASDVSAPENIRDLTEYKDLKVGQVYRHTVSKDLFEIKRIYERNGEISFHASKQTDPGDLRTFDANAFTEMLKSNKVWELSSQPGSI